MSGVVFLDKLTQIRNSIRFSRDLSISHPIGYLFFFSFLLLIDCFGCRLVDWSFLSSFVCCSFAAVVVSSSFLFCVFTFVVVD